MRLVSFSVSNFRSITSAKKVLLSDYSVLVGANNEGKSNILHALTLGMEFVEDFKRQVRRDSLGRLVRIRPSALSNRTAYTWQRDFPLSKQNSKKSDLTTEVVLEFQLSEDEVSSFHQEMGSKLNGTLPIAIKFGQHRADVSIVKPGRGSKALNKKATKIAEFISRHVTFEYIPAVRTSKRAEDVVGSLLSKELEKLEVQDEYRQALQKIKDVQEPVLKELSESVSKTISSFLPSVKSVEISMEQNARLRAYQRGLSINVDDGDKTSLDRKGDGVKSLVALALMRHAAQTEHAETSSVVAIEEPEAHLHPKAVHELRDVLESLSENNQVILTSHSPLFVNPTNLKSTIVVKASKAAAAESMKEIREVLGVRLADNLQSARLVAIVEGDEDIEVLEALMTQRFPELRSAIETGDLVFDAMGGASNLSYKIRNYRASATLVQCFLDGDKSGKDAVSKATVEAILRVDDYNLIQVAGKSEAELEDILNEKEYRAEFLERFGVDVAIKPKGESKAKWSDVMKKKFIVQGKVWNPSVQMEVKNWLSKHVTSDIGRFVLEPRMGPIDAFAGSIKRKLGISGSD